MITHKDKLIRLSENISLREKLQTIHSVMKGKLPFVARISVTLYDSKTGYVYTFIDSSGRDYPLEFYESPLENCPSLIQIAESKAPRVLNDLSVFSTSDHKHTRSIYEQGYRASYTVPLFWNSTLTGFIFFNSYEADSFEDQVLTDLDLYSHLISTLVYSELGMIRTTYAALLSCLHHLHLRDGEKIERLERVSRYARFMARKLAEQGKCDLTEEEIERIGWFAMLFDIGKIAIPELVLMTPLSLMNQSELQLLRSLTTQGLQLIDTFRNICGQDPFAQIDLLKNMIKHHDPAMITTETDIPIEARCVNTADIFEQLVYGPFGEIRLSSREAVQVMKRLRSVYLDKDCIEVLEKCVVELGELQSRLLPDPRQKWNVLQAQQTVN